MGKTTLILGVALFILLILFAFQMTKAKQAEAKLADAEKLGQATRTLLRSIDVRCSARATEFLDMRDCIDDVLEKDNFVEQEFRNFNARTNETGLFVVKNIGPRTYNGSAFVLRKNGAVVTNGCHITTEILPEYACRFTVEELCKAGDVLEVAYTSVVEEEQTVIRLVTRTC